MDEELVGLTAIWFVMPLNMSFVSMTSLRCTDLIPRGVEQTVYVD